MLFPKKVKNRRWQLHRKNLSKPRVATRGTEVSFGDFGMRTLTQARIRSNQIEAARRVIHRAMGRGGRVWIRIFPDRPVTKKAAEVPMGKGKGDLDHYEIRVRPGRILFEVTGVSEEIARNAFTKASKKLPLKINFAKK